jgi:hypothetical protein
MKRALIVLAFLAVLVPAAIAQSMDVGQRQFQNRLICGPSLLRNPAPVQKYSPNNNYDFVGYFDLNVYNCSNPMTDLGRVTSEDQPARRKKPRP